VTLAESPAVGMACPPPVHPVGVFHVPAAFQFPLAFAVKAHASADVAARVMFAGLVPWKELVREISLLPTGPVGV
jgi:hypothetical protein